jgi:ferrous iron transport protein B
MSVAGKGIVRVALAGNPNAGKTTIFNALTGAHHKVGNYPGVTVEKREGTRSRGGREYRFIDLPGVYSLTAYSMDEVVARDFLLEEKPDVIIDVLDSANLERNLYLCLQFQELGIPVVGALNMSDEAEAKGIDVDAAALSAVLGIPFLKTVGSKGSGTEDLLDAIDRELLRAAGAGEAAASRGGARVMRYGEEVESRLAGIEEEVASDAAFALSFPPRWLAVKLIEKDADARTRLAGHPRAPDILRAADAAVSWLEAHYGRDAQVIVSEQRYGYIHGAVSEAVSIKKAPVFSLTERIDKVIMNRFLALPIFALALWGVFQATFFLGSYPAAWLETFFSWLGRSASALIPAGILRSLLVDGVIAGVGGVMSFVPLIVILFFFLSILEDLGYLSRAAFASDKFLHAFGLHGQSVFPMMLGFGCSVPAIMAARTLKNPRDRIVTILIIPFMSCGAKLPVHVLLAAAFFPKNAAAMVMLVYGVGVAVSLVAALVLRKTIARGDPTPFVMELPPYRAPTLRGILWHVWEKTAHYLKKAGTVILVASLAIWTITTFPAYRPPEAVAGEASAPVTDGKPDARNASAALEHSLAGRIGKFIEPSLRPLGFDWKVAIATVTGFAAKEVVVSTLGVLYGRTGAETEGGLREALRADPHFSPLTALVLMLFILAIPPCFAALATVKSELGWKWLGFSFAFMLAVGWTLAFAARHIGLLLGAA